MKWRGLVIIFLCSTVFAMGEDVSTTTVTATTENPDSGSFVPDPCLTDSNVQDPKTMEACEEMWQAQRNNIQPGTDETTMTSTHKEVTGPSLSPLSTWEQALEPQATTVTNTESESVLPVTSTTEVKSATPVDQQSSIDLQQGQKVTNKESVTTVREGETDVVNKEATITNQNGNIETSTTSSETVYHNDAPP